MKRIAALFLMLVMLCGSVACSPAKKEVQAIDVKEWVNAQIENNTLLSFDLGGTPYAEHIGTWDKTVEEGDGGYTVTYKKDGVILTTDIEIDEQANAVEWVHHFKNEAQADSPVIANILALDATVAMEAPKFTGANGSNGQESDFEPFTQDLTEKPECLLEQIAGFSSQYYLPYFDISNGELGVMGAIGWTGDWQLKVTHREGQVNMKAGMMATSIALYAGEQMRTPSIVLQFFKGDQDAGHNAWRQLILKSYTPADESGEPIRKLPIAYNLWGGSGSANNISYLAKVEDGIFDTVWIDAGWYGDFFSKSHERIWSEQLGNIYFSDNLYPNGFRDLDAATENRGMDLLIWLEVERAGDKSMMYKTYPQYYMPRGNTNAMGYYLYDFSNDEATDFMIDFLSDILIDAGAEWYRIDSGKSSRYDWRLMDKNQGENRTGIHEIKWITNFYRFLDTVRERIPGLMIDNCAGGGRRLDIEMMSRSVPLWRTDYSVGLDSDDDDGVRYLAAGLTWWLPLSCGGAANFEYTDVYSWRSMFGTGLTVGNKVDQRLLNQFLICRDLMLGDYYMLSHEYKDGIAVYEFIDPETSEGFIMAFRPDGCREAKITCKLKGLNPEKNYRLENDDTGATGKKTGKEWMEDGLTISLPNQKESVLIYINRKMA